MAERQLIASVDFDGVVFPRPPFQLEATRTWLLRPFFYNRPFAPETTIAKDGRVMSNAPLASNEEADLKRSMDRKVKPNMRQFLESIGADLIIGNTGRHFKKPIVNMTMDLLREGGIDDIFSSIYFKPEDVTSDESKYWVFRELRDMGYRFRHYDDNARLVKLMAPEFPEDEFVIVQDLTSGILFSERELVRHPNVTRVAMHKDGFPVRQTWPKTR